MSDKRERQYEPSRSRRRSGPLDEARQGESRRQREQQRSESCERKVYTPRRQVPRRYSGDVKPKTRITRLLGRVIREPIGDLLTSSCLDARHRPAGCVSRLGRLRCAARKRDASAGPREKGAFKHVALALSYLNRARVELPDGVEGRARDGVRVAPCRAPTCGTTSTTSRSFGHPEQTAQSYTKLGSMLPSVSR